MHAYITFRRGVTFKTCRQYEWAAISSFIALFILFIASFAFSIVLFDIYFLILTSSTRWIVSFL